MNLNSEVRIYKLIKNLYDKTYGFREVHPAHLFPFENLNYAQKVECICLSFRFGRVFSTKFMLHYIEWWKDFEVSDWMIVISYQLNDLDLIEVFVFLFSVVEIDLTKPFLESERIDNVLKRKVLYDIKNYTRRYKMNSCEDLEWWGISENENTLVEIRSKLKLEL